MKTKIFCHFYSRYWRSGFRLRHLANPQLVTFVFCLLLALCSVPNPAGIQLPGPCPRCLRQSYQECHNKSKTVNTYRHNRLLFRYGEHIPLGGGAYRRKNKFFRNIHNSIRQFNSNESAGYSFCFQRYRLVVVQPLSGNKNCQSDNLSGDGIFKIMVGAIFNAG